MEYKMITFNTISAPVRKIAVISKNNQQNTAQQPAIAHSALPAYPRNISFGMAFSNPTYDDYEKGMNNCTIYNTYSDTINVHDNSVLLGSNVTIKNNLQTDHYFTAGNDIEGISLYAGNDMELGSNIKLTEYASTSANLTAKNNINASELKARCEMNLGNDIVSTEQIKTSSGKITAGDRIRTKYLASGGIAKLGNDINVELAETKGDFIAGNNATIAKIESNAGIKLGDNATVSDSASAENNFIAGENADIKNISVKGDVSLGSITKLNSIAFERKEFQNQNRYLILRDENIEQKDKINIYLGDIASLTIKTPSGDRKILDKFEFIDNVNNEIVPNDHPNIHVMEI